MSNITLVTRPDKSNDAVIELLEEVMEKAKSGEILSIGVCAVLKGGNIYDGAAGGVDSASLLGANILLQKRIVGWFE